LTNNSQQVTAVWQKWRFSASYDSFVVKQTFVLRMNICGENRHLRQAAADFTDSEYSGPNSVSGFQTRLMYESSFGNFIVLGDFIVVNTLMF